MTSRPVAWLALATFLLAGCAATREAGPGAADPAHAATGPVVSLLGEELTPPRSPTFEQVRQLEAARAAALADPDDPEKTVWHGRRTAYTWDYRGAIAIYTEGIERHRGHAPLYRHRGHRHISVRQLDRAVHDLEVAAALVGDRADEVEPDGQPNRLGIPTSTLKSNIWYHLGLAYYLEGDFHEAHRCYTECLRYSKNPDMLVATSHWLYMTCRRIGRDEEAARVLARITPDLDVIENRSYHELLLMYKGLRSADDLMNRVRGDDLQMATTGYGIANWHLYNGRTAEGLAICRDIISGPYWSAFGYIAAEAELSRPRSMRAE